MAAEWYYVANQQQAGPVELEALRSMLHAGSLTSASLVFGPGLADWVQAGQVPQLVGGSPMYAAAPAPAVGMLGYRGVDTANTGISPRAADMLRQTKPWARFMAIMMFIGAGLMALGGLIVMVASQLIGFRAPSAFLIVFGGIYIGLGALCMVPAVFLNRYASGIGSLLQTNRTLDLEQALQAQKSYWKFIGIFTIIIISIYLVAFLVSVAAR